ncbi:MAG: hypothetical protein ACREOG_00555 [Gemmatimonadaceae bacterium]
MADQPNSADTTSRFRSTLIRVMSMQLFTLLLLAILQLRYSR